MMPLRYSWREAAAFTFLALPLGLLAERSYRGMPHLPDLDPSRPLPSLSIIVPARNEATNLATLLPTLQKLRYSGSYEIIVVDDQSGDGTGEVARAHGARVLTLDELPSGWLGKPHACHRGAQIAQGEWILFTDADTRHTGDGPGRAVAYALDQGLDGLSLFLQQACHGEIDRLALATAFAGLFASASGSAGVLNGQYILLRRHAYLESEGFAAVRHVALEDVALGRHLQGLGYRLQTLNGDDVAGVRMYDDPVKLWNGLTRLGGDSLRWVGPRGLLSALLITAEMSPLVAATGVLAGRLRPWWLPATWGAAALSMAPWTRRFGSTPSAALAPLGALLVQLAAVWGLARRLLGGSLRWKDRDV